MAGSTSSQGLLHREVRQPRAPQRDCLLAYHAKALPLEEWTGRYARLGEDSTEPPLPGYLLDHPVKLRADTPSYGVFAQVEHVQVPVSLQLSEADRRAVLLRD